VQIDTRALMEFDNIIDSIIASWSQKPILWIAMIWMLLVLPGINVRGVYFEEQTVIGLARGAFEDGWWLSPHLYGERFVERPVLMSWLIALLSWPIGSIFVPLARLPTAVSGLAGAFLVYYFVKPRTSVTGGAVAALCFLTSPVVFQDAFIAEPDLMLSVLMFAAFVVWWAGEENNNVSISRWLAVALLLTAAGLVKGPQPLAFFYIGVFCYYVLVRREWRGILGLAFSGIFPAAVIAAWYVAVYEPGDLDLWQEHSRLHFWRQSLGVQLFEFLDITVRFIVVVLPSVIIIALGNPRFAKSAEHRNLLAALLLYACMCTLLLWFWPGARYRYAMPAVPALAAAAGILFDQMRLRQNALRYVGVCTIVALGCFQIAFNWLVMANLPDLFAKSRIAGRSVAAVMETAPATLYAVHGAGDDAILVYVPPPIRLIPLEALPQEEFPAWALLTPEQESQLRASRPELNLQPRLVLHKHGDAQLVYVDKR
jgi:4-amino-4-deoxy-L-arabinose transferase-like glycosyltransferase